MDKIRIETGDICLVAELNGSDTANGIYKMLPLSGSANVWGDEIYFSIPFHLEQSPDARQEVEIGDLGFWPVGDAFCIFFGPTPVSNGEHPKAYSPVNVFGHIMGDAKILRKVSNGDEIKVTKEI
jgi:hypothetical protein